MNKRQAKKAAKKVVCPFVDEFNLLTLSPKEHEEALRDFHEYAQKHCRYKHYKDKRKKFRMQSCAYHFPVGEAYREALNNFLKNVRRHQPTITHEEAIGTIKHMKRQCPEQIKKVLS